METTSPAQRLPHFLLVSLYSLWNACLEQEGNSCLMNQAQYVKFKETKHGHIHVRRCPCGCLPTRDSGSLSVVELEGTVTVFAVLTWISWNFLKLCAHTIFTRKLFSKVINSCWKLNLLPCSPGLICCFRGRPGTNSFQNHCPLPAPWAWTLEQCRLFPEKGHGCQRSRWPKEDTGVRRPGSWSRSVTNLLWGLKWLTSSLQTSV